MTQARGAAATTPTATLAASESDHFGVRIGRVHVDDDDSVDDLLDACRAERIELVVARCDAGDLATARRLAAAGFELMDTLVRYAFDLDRRRLPDVDVEGIRSGTPGDADAVEAVARTALRGHRGHYQADQRLDRAVADALYATWARESCRAAGHDETVVVAERDGAVVGFATGRMRAPDTGVGLLAAVLSEHRRGGLYRGLLVARLAAQRDLGATRALVATQLPHLAPQHAWVDLGYRLESAEHTFHRWLG